MNTLRLIVSHVTTPRDQRRIEAALRSLDGVGRGSVDLEGGWVTVTYNPRCLRVWTVVTVIERLGYPVDGLMPTAQSRSTPSAGILRQAGA